MTQLSESYREKLHKYISDVSHLSSEVLSKPLILNVVFRCRVGGLG